MNDQLWTENELYIENKVNTIIDIKYLNGTDFVFFSFCFFDILSTVFACLLAPWLRKIDSLQSK